MSDGHVATSKPCGKTAATWSATDDASVVCGTCCGSSGRGSTSPQDAASKGQIKSHAVRMRRWEPSFSIAVNVKGAVLHVRPTCQPVAMGGVDPDRPRHAGRCIEVWALCRMFEFFSRVYTPFDVTSISRFCVLSGCGKSGQSGYGNKTLPHPSYSGSKEVNDHSPDRGEVFNKRRIPNTCEADVVVGDCWTEIEFVVLILGPLLR